jgi:hypothetical protein
MSRKAVTFLLQLRCLRTSISPVSSSEDDPFSMKALSLEAFRPTLKYESVRKARSFKGLYSARVVLVPDAARLEINCCTKLRSAMQRHMAPGQYKLFAWKSVPVTAYMNTAFVAAYDTQGQVIRIMEGTTSNVVVKLIQ